MIHAVMFLTLNQSYPKPINFDEIKNIKFKEAFNKINILSL
jgi:hypothetical protein